MGGLFSSPSIDGNEIEELMKETGLKRNKILKLHDRFCALDKGRRGYLTKDDLLEIPEIESNPVGEMLVGGFFPQRFLRNGEPDIRHSVLTLDFKEFVKKVAVFKPVKHNESEGRKNHKTSDEEAEIHRPAEEQIINSTYNKARFLYSLLDRTGKNRLTKEDLYELLGRMTGANIGSEQLFMLADRMVREADLENDGTMTFEDFYNANKGIDITRGMSLLSLG